ncbi:MAG: TadE family protein [Candidatus Limnocylindria bacterium]
MVEFALTIVIFIGLLMGVFDLGRAVYMSNGVGESAREIARVASVHPGTPISNPSADTQVVIDRQQGIIFELDDPTFACVDILGQTVTPPSAPCLPGNWVKVEIHAAFSPVTPIFNLIPLDLESTSSIQIP